MGIYKTASEKILAKNKQEGLSNSMHNQIHLHFYKKLFVHLLQDFWVLWLEIQQIWLLFECKQTTSCQKLKEEIIKMWLMHFQGYANKKEWLPYGEEQPQQLWEQWH